MTDLPPGLRDEVLTAATEGTLRAVDEKFIARAELESAEAPDRLARHLAAVAQRLLQRLSDNDASAEEQARVVNRAVELLAAGKADEQDLLALPPDLLTGILAAPVGLGEPYLPPRPVIPLSANELLVNGHGQPAIGQQLQSELPSAAGVDFLVSFVIWSGVRTLLDELRGVVDRGGRLRVITTTYMGATERKTLDELVRAGAQVRVAFDADRTKLHAKAWMLHRPGGLTTAFLGSSNVSYTALHQGLEWNVRLSESDAWSLVDRMRATFESYWGDDAFEQYDPGAAGAWTRCSSATRPARCSTPSRSRVSTGRTTPGRSASCARCCTRCCRGSPRRRARGSVTASPSPSFGRAPTALAFA